MDEIEAQKKNFSNCRSYLIALAKQRKLFEAQHIRIIGRIRDNKERPDDAARLEFLKKEIINLKEEIGSYHHS